ncbi:NAD(P)-dependent dehydrogenase (short-subunit alcohol dehydrogenase family) [Ochrobactrum daejeonense]|uniref:NAD(P)-dependent dehydrogenase (Short-subunit alcohol dehydrogenase family) n=1 Tax=Brucella daejeonensis TaxID=659015 RepID=A0A7W9ENE9_9HYPH|nr:SDR family oxidoreductase [Brucella daejeonensis]MBB5704488.1 NAD(P)-dependent dehydrogenase (short-subunit alcohol dehydrogenase family) [Brucella daejeonensis]
MSKLCAVVTGGARNIGQAISLRLQEDGYRVIVVDIEEPEAESLHADARRVDLSDKGAAIQVFAEIAETLPVAALINNVGVVRPALFDDVDIDDFDVLMHLNVRTAMIATKAMVPVMRKLGRGRIVMNTSRVTLGKEARSLYSASKGALQSMARTWALELAPQGITVNCVAPGPIGTTVFWRNNPPEAAATRAIVDAIPVGRMGEPDDVANAVGFFCDPRSDFVTGQTLFVCGGVTVG